MRIITREERRKKAQEQTSRPNPRVFLFHFLYSEKEEKKRKKAVKGVIIDATAADRSTRLWRVEKDLEALNILRKHSITTGHQ